MGPGMEERALTMGFPEKFEYCVKYQERELPLDDDNTVLTLQQRLLLYALKEQGTKGKNTASAPSWWDTRERAKWSAWQELGDMNKFEAMVYFTKTVEEIEKEWLVKELALEETAIPVEDDKGEEEEEEIGGDIIMTCSDACTMRHNKSICVRCNEDWGRHVNHICTDGGRGTWAVKKEEDKDASDGAVETDVASLLKQIQTLKYRLNTALRDVQVRDGIIVELKADNQQLRHLLSHHNIASITSQPPSVPTSPLRHPDTLPPPSNPPAGYFQAKQKPTWMQWFTGADPNASPTLI
eukprot:TRINITY_DN7165_c0_g1_i1.p1 TRINITY_DN7165_c0_g1~~TRINITY_DN7165_c0_g1_i1.p1  ORF type:complete len:307 (+),score=71.02 TRINITY_DN7165_c0_g1_i1:35-922(+)